MLLLHAIAPTPANMPKLSVTEGDASLGRLGILLAKLGSTGGVFVEIVVLELAILDISEDTELDVKKVLVLDVGIRGLDGLRFPDRTPSKNLTKG